MGSGRFRFEEFTLDSSDRRLTRGTQVVELNARYLDALALMVTEPGRLVSKDRFMDEVWRGIPVTDEALTQCIRSLRKALGDDATRPRFIETVPKYGYRFIAAVEAGDDGELASPTPAPTSSAENMAPEGVSVKQAPAWLNILLLAGAAMIGGGFAGFVGGIFYGVTGAAQPLAPGMGAISILLVLVCLCILVAMAGGLAVGLGIAALGERGWAWSMGGGALGGFIVGGIAKLLGLDAFTLLLGQSPGNITGASEGLALGAAVGLGVWLTGRMRARLGITLAAVICGATGIAIALAGGRLMGGSLDLLARQVPDSQLRFDQLGQMLGESGFGPVSQALTSGMEAALFGGFVAFAMTIARRQITAK